MSDRWIVIRHWEDFQAYNDRTVPWIRVYAELQHSDQWLQLPAGRRGMLTSLWLEYMMSRCRLPADTRELSRRLNARIRQDDLEALNQAGFLDVLSEPNPTHVRMASEKPRTSRAPERREEKKREDTRATRTSPNGSEPSPYAHHGPRPEAARAWIDNGLALQVPEAALRAVLADEFKISNEKTLDELMERAATLKSELAGKETK